MKRVLISWIGANDLKSLTGDQSGPIIDALGSGDFDSAELLYSYPKTRVKPYLDHLHNKVDINITAHSENLTSPIDFTSIYQVANKHLQTLSTNHKHHICILLSPGTPAMQAVWILLGKTLYSTSFYQSSIEQGLQEIKIPFDIAAEFRPNSKAISSTQIADISIAPVSVDAAFDDIITQNPAMERLKQNASIIAHEDVPVLVYGETGTGKELFSTAIHNASNRKDKAFIPVNCGAIPPELIDSTLFGHKKGAFTGAHQDKKGLFQQADKGTIFLDEFGELPKDAQVRLLRVLQNGEITPVGANKPTYVDVRVIAATNKNLIMEVAEGNFREDLFYRVAVGVLHLPPLREREGDIGLLGDILLNAIYASNIIQSDKKIISVKGKKLLLSSQWKGNVRELHSTLLRASLWSQGKEITETDIQAALFKMPQQTMGILNQEFHEEFNIQEVMGEVATHYINRALTESQGNKTSAAKKLGLASYQTLKGWIEKYSIKS